MNRRQRIRYRWWKAVGDPRVWATVGALLLVASSLLSCWTLYDTKRSLCEQRRGGRQDTRALAVAMVDEVTKPPVTIDAKVKARLIERAERRALDELPPPDC